MRRFFLLSILFGLLTGWTGRTQTPVIKHWETIVLAGDIWKYFPGTSKPPAAWRDFDFNDSLWFSGPGGIGYGDNDDRTVIDPVLSVYLRKTFTIVKKENIALAILHMDYDDAFVAYLNGVEIARANIGTSGVVPAYNQPSIGYHEALLYQGLPPEAFPLSPEALDTLLKQGDNILAIQVHNHDINSSDLSSSAFFSVGITDTSFTYTQPPDWFMQSMLFTSSDLPVVIIDTHGQSIPDDPRIIASMGIIYNGPGQRNSINDPRNNYNGRISIEIHGESSTMFPKKSYRLETQDSLGENNNVSLLGMPKENDWILYAPYSDKSLIRNALTYLLTNDIGRWAPHTRFCELMLNGQYMGIYLLTEKIKRDKNRVNIAKLTSDEVSGSNLTGGYILRIDKIDPGDPGWTSMPSPMSPGENYIFFQYYDPKYDNLAEVQRQYIRNFIFNFESALNGSNFTSPTDGYAKYADVGSFLDYMIMNEIGKNVDAYIFSVYMFKDIDTVAGGKLNMGPVWDFNLAYGNVNYLENSQVAPGWTYQDHYRTYWYRRLMQDKNFVNHLKCRWDTLRQHQLSDNRIMEVIDSLVTTIHEAQERNFTRWPILGKYVWPNQFIGNTYQKEVDFLKNWLFTRLHWMDTNMPGDCEDWIHLDKQALKQCKTNIYPNPFSDEVHFNFQGLTNIRFTVEIYDLVGRKVASLDGRNSTPVADGYRIDWNGKSMYGQCLQPGLYIIQAVSHNKVIFTGKVLKN